MAVPVPEVVPFENPERRSVPRSKIKLQGRSVPFRSLFFLADLPNIFEHFFQVHFWGNAPIWAKRLIILSLTTKTA